MNLIRWFRGLGYDGKSYWVSVASLILSTFLTAIGVYIALVQIHIQNLQEAEAKWQRRQEEVRVQVQEKAEKLEKAKDAAKEFRSEGVAAQQ